MKKNKILIIVVLSCVIVLALLITVIAFFDSWVGRHKLNEVRDAAEGCEEILINSPLYFDRYSSVAETVVRGEDARRLSELLLGASKDVSFDGTVDGSLGYWDTRLTFFEGDQRYDVYLKDDGMYVTGNCGYIFEPDGGSEDAYGELYGEVMEILNGIE